MFIERVWNNIWLVPKKKTENIKLIRSVEIALYKVNEINIETMSGDRRKQSIHRLKK